MKRSSAESDFVGRLHCQHFRRLLLFVGLLVVSVGRTVADESRAPAHRLIVGWDDSVIVCGPGTVAGMDSPLAIEQMVKRWKARGHHGIYWRVDEAMLPGRFMTRWKPKVSPGVNYLLERVDQKLHEFPVLKTLLAAAEREQLEVWAWYPTLYSNGAPPTGPGFTQAWLYENKFGTDHPEVLSVDRVGNKHFMVWEYAYVQVTPAANVMSSDDVGLAMFTTGDKQPLMELRTHQATWHYREGDTLIDTKVSAAFDAWNHLQLVIDPQDRTCRVMLQVIGAAPRELCYTSLNRLPATDSPLAVELFCHRSLPHSDGPAFDNLRVTRGVQLTK